MIPSSFGSNNSNTPPQRRSQPRDANSGDKPSTEKVYIGSDSWIEVDNCWIFLPSIENILQSRAILQIEVEKCLALLKAFINCAIDGIPAPVRSPLELFVGTGFLLKEACFPAILVSLFQSDFSKELIKNKQQITTDTAKAQAALNLPSLFVDLVNAMSKACNFVKTAINLNGIKQLNSSQINLEKSICKSIFHIFQDKKIKSDDEKAGPEIKHLMDVILSNGTSKCDKTVRSELISLLREAAVTTQQCMQIFANQICSYFINNNMPTPFSSEEIFTFIRLNTKMNLDGINEIEKLTGWKDYIFYSIARIFLKDKTPPGPIENCELIIHLNNHFKFTFHPTKSLCIRKDRFMKAIVASYIISNVKNQPPQLFICDFTSAITMSLDKLEVSFLLLKELLNLIVKKLPEKLFSNSSTDIKRSILLMLENSKIRELIVAAFPKYEVCETHQSTYSKSQSQNFSLDSSDVKIPQRRSKVRSRRKIKPFVDNNKTTAQKPIMHIDQQISLPELNITSYVLEGIIASSLAILLLHKVNYSNLSPIEIVRKAIFFTKNKHSIPDIILESNCSWIALDKAKQLYLKGQSLPEGISPFNRSLNMLLEELPNFISLLKKLFTDLRSELIEQVKISSSAYSFQSKTIEHKLILRNFYSTTQSTTANFSIKIALLQTLILSLLKDPDEE